MSIVAAAKFVLVFVAIYFGTLGLFAAWRGEWPPAIFYMLAAIFFAGGLQ